MSTVAQAAPQSGQQAAPQAAQQSAPQPAPRRRDPEGRRRAILDAASAILAEQGTAALTHRAIAARAGVSLGSTTQYFASIDELREAALQQLADEIDSELARLAAFLSDGGFTIETTVAEMHAFTCDRRAVQSEIALISTGVTDPGMRPLARRWQERFIEILSEHMSRDRAVAVAVFLDGATVHAGLFDEPLTRAQLEESIRTLIAMPDPATP